MNLIVNIPSDRELVELVGDLAPGEDFPREGEETDGEFGVDAERETGYPDDELSATRELSADPTTDDDEGDLPDAAHLRGNGREAFHTDEPAQAPTNCLLCGASSPCLPASLFAKFFG